MAQPTATYEWTAPSENHEGGEVTSINVRIDAVEAQRLLAAYSPQSGTSPGVSDCRPLVRAVLDAILAAQQ